MVATVQDDFLQSSARKRGMLDRLTHHTDDDIEVWLLETEACHDIATSSVGFRTEGEIWTQRGAIVRPEWPRCSFNVARARRDQRLFRGSRSIDLKLPPRRSVSNIDHGKSRMGLVE